ncbi:MAG: amidohydrolase family protein [Elusimicrobia bacterium]|nr:amidohydrolase family protein [Elusimicrobiota bacterium]
MLYLKDANLVDWKTLRAKRGHWAVTPDGPRAVRSVPRGSRALDCEGRIAARSFVVAHHHVYSALARGMPPPPRPPKDFVDILKLVWWNLDKKLDRAMVGACALAAAVEALKSGVTFVIDHHASPNAVTGSLHIIAEAFDRAGLGHLLCYELSDRDGPGPRQAGLDEQEAYLAKRQGLVGLHASFTVGDELLRRAVALAERHGTGLHVHAAEAASDEEDCRREHRTSVLERFAAAGVLKSPRTILAHGVHLSAPERALLARSKAWLAQNPESNMNNAVGFLDAKGLPRVMLGTDGLHADMPASLKAAYFGSQGREGLTPAAALARLRAAHEYLASNGFAGDGEDNLVVLDYAPPTPVTAANWPAHMVFGVSRADVRHVVAQGRLVVKDRRTLTLDEERAMDYARGQAERLWRRL